MTNIAVCPVCNNPKLNDFLVCRDYTVSHETFSIMKCSQCTLGITSPRPSLNDLGKYYQSQDYISHTDKAKSIIDKIYKISRVFTLKWKVNIIHKFHPTFTSLLDYGCGTGDFLQAIKNKNKTVAGLEPSENPRAIAKKKTGAQIEDDINKIQNTYDVITLWHVLEHVHNLDEILDELKAKLKPDGILLIAVPNHQSKDSKKYKEHWAGYDVPRHLWHFTQLSMSKLLEKHSLKLQHVLPMKLDSYYVSLLSEKYIKTKNTPAGMFKAFISGFASNVAARKNNDYSSLIYIAKK